MSQLSSQYDPHAVEEDIHQKWEASNAFSPAPPTKEGTSPFVMMLPPPNITGNLHLGHALQDTIMDILARYHRMKGETVLWVPGLDHAALPTNKILVDQLKKEGKTPQQIGRQAFDDHARAWYAATGSAILYQMKRLGASADWSRSRFTMDKYYNAAVQEAFIRYYERGYIYRSSRIINWDPKAQTTVSDLEIEYRTQKTPYYYLQYGPFVISTARPETKFGDKYVVIHPSDKRYARYQHGDTFKAEWINGPVTATVIKDEAADPDVGSGVMTITPWHSVADFAIAQRHNLDMEQIIGLDGKLLPMAGQFAGLSIAEARPKIVERLSAKGLLLKIDDDYEHNIAQSERGQGVIEPQVMRQWFVDMSKLQHDTIKVVEEELVKFIPLRWKKHLLTWMHSVRDWNVSRQIWLGHRIPVWWKRGTRGTSQEEGNYVVARAKPPGDYEQDPDVLDTWFSSALWPFAALGWPRHTGDLKRFYPTSVLVTGRDILYLWVARMIFSGLELMKGAQNAGRPMAERIPFREVFIHPTVLTKDGQRMSKSLGTGIDPLHLIDRYGADATRFGLMSQMSYDSQAIKFAEADVKAGRNFTNKIWNMARLIQSGHLAEDTPGVADSWIQHRFNLTRDQYYQALDQYKIGEAARLLYGFLWNDFADWYLEIVKHEGNREAAHLVFIESLKLLHPIMPFMTEALWPNFGQSGLIIRAPLAQRLPGQAAADLAMAKFQDIVTVARTARTILSIPPGAIIKIWVPKPPLAKALAALTRSEVAEQEDASMQRFPLVTHGFLGLASPHINKASIAQAAAKLGQTIADLTARVGSLDQLIARMQGKAPASVLAAKRLQISRLAAQRDAAQLSRDALLKK